MFLLIRIIHWLYQGLKTFLVTLVISKYWEKSFSSTNKLVSQVQAILAARREPAQNPIRPPKVLYVFENKCCIF